MKLIGINGFKTSGKDTTYRLVKEIVGEQGTVERRAFADKLKIMAAKALGFDRPDEELIALMDEAKERWIFNIARNNAPLDEDYLSQTLMAHPYHVLSGREYLQHFGGRAREVFGPNFWVDQVVPMDWQQREFLWMIDKVEGSPVLPDWGCVTDVRYPNEAERVLALGGEVWEIQRPGLTSDGHSSEQPLPPELVTATILNDGTIDDLRETVELALDVYSGVPSEKVARVAA